MFVCLLLELNTGPNRLDQLVIGLPCPRVTALWDDRNMSVYRYIYIVYSTVPYIRVNITLKDNYVEQRTF